MLNLKELKTVLSDMVDKHSTDCFQPQGFHLWRSGTEEQKKDVAENWVLNARTKPVQTNIDYINFRNAVVNYRKQADLMVTRVCSAVKYTNAKPMVKNFAFEVLKCNNPSLMFETERNSFKVYCEKCFVEVYDEK